MLLTCIAIASMQTPSWASTYENIGIKSADCVVVARVLEVAQWSERPLFTSENVERAGETVWVGRVPLRTTLTLNGSIGTEFVYVQSQESKLEGGSMGVTKLFPNALAEASVGSLVLVWLHRPVVHDLLPSPRGSDHFFRKSGNQEMVYPSIEPIPVLPEANYIVEGQTPVEKYCSILVQAYAHNPGAENAITYLSKLASVKPWWKRQNGMVVLNGQDMDGPGFFGFARSKLIPRLLTTQGTTTVRKLRANYYAYILAGDNPISETHQQLLEELDATSPNPNEPKCIDGIIGTQEYISGKLTARLSSIRAVAVRALSVKPENIAAIVDRLQADSADTVHQAAVDWLQRLKMSDLDRYREAPIARLTRGVLENRQALIDYWSTR